MIQSHGLLEFGQVELEERLAMLCLSLNSCHSWKVHLTDEVRNNFIDTVYPSLLDHFEHSDSIYSVLSHYASYQALNDYFDLLFYSELDQFYIDGLSNLAVNLSNLGWSLNIYNIVSAELKRLILKRFDGVSNDIFVHDCLSRRLQLDMMLLTDFLHYKALEDVKRYASLMEVKDSLTDLYTYSTFVDELDRIVAHCQRTQSRVLVLKANIKSLATINQRYGYKIGNQTLQTFAFLTQELIRKSDVLARGEADNFYLAMTNAGKEEAKQICQRICETLEQQLEIPVTLRFGGACYEPDKPISTEQLLTLTEQHLIYACERSQISDQHESSIYFSNRSNVIRLIK